MKIIGHRGARGLAPENTLAAIKAGLAAGVDAVEIDVRVTHDSIVVLNHDSFLVDDRENKIFISRHTYLELAQIKADLATLEAAIDCVNGQCPLYVEIKPNEPTGPVIAVLQKYLNSGSKITDFAVLSFSQRALRTVRAALPTMPLVVNEKWSSVRARWRAKKLGTKQIQMNQRWLWRGFLKAMKHSGYQITPYTVNSPAQAKRWERYIDGIITDYPDRFGA